MNIQLNNQNPLNNNNFRFSNSNNNQDYSYDTNSSYEEGNSVNSDDIDSEYEETLNEHQEEEALKEMLLKKRSDLIEDLNIFQYKHADKFVKRKDE